MEAQSASRQYQITLLQERSEGTFARVYLAEAVSGGVSRIVAVKVLKETWSDSVEILNRTRDEARLLARLRHRSILRVESLAQVDGLPAIVMEFVDGLDLGKLIEELAKHRRALPPRAAYRVALDAASALEAAFFKVPYGMDDALRVVHRDIKPSNIMVSVEGEVKVLDFGTARYTSDSRLAKSGALRVGSLKYMSPERREGERGDHSGDVYALGLVLIEMLSGEMLPLLPLDRREHDVAIAEVIARLRGLSLPNSEWDDSLRQTLAGMCAGQAEGRLNASQVVQLLRAFEGQAAGSSLETFAAETIEPLAREAFGPANQGPLAGSRIVVTLPTGDERPLADQGWAGPEPAPAHGPPASPPQSPSPTASQAPPLGAGWSDQPADSLQTQPGPAAPPPAEGGNKALIVGAAAVFVGGLAVLVLAAMAAVGAWMFLGRAPSSVAEAPAPAEAAEAAGASQPTAAEAALVELAAEDDTIQWVRLSGEDGTRLINATPKASGSVPLGRYELSAKVVARPAVKGELLVKRGGTQLVCERAEKSSSVICTDGVTNLELMP